MEDHQLCKIQSPIFKTTCDGGGIPKQNKNVTTTRSEVGIVEMPPQITEN